MSGYYAKIHSQGGVFQLFSLQKTTFKKKNVENRLEWCKEHQGWDEEWKNVVFSDESRFCLFHCDGRMRVWRRVGERYHADCLMPTMKFGGGSVMMWGCFSWWGVGPLVLIEGTLDQNGYVNLMSNHLVPYLRKVDKQCSGVIFQEDNAPCHVAEYTSWWQQTHSINRMSWPAQSPDLNPIEHLWDHLDRQIRKRRPSPTSSAVLAAVLQDEWGRIPLDVLRNLMGSMPTRVAAVIKAKGWHTSY